MNAHDLAARLYVKMLKQYVEQMNVNNIEHWQVLDDLLTSETMLDLTGQARELLDAAIAEVQCVVDEMEYHDYYEDEEESQPVDTELSAETVLKSLNRMEQLLEETASRPSVSMDAAEKQKKAEAALQLAAAAAKAKACRNA